MCDRMLQKLADGRSAPGMLFLAVGLTVVSACNGGGPTEGLGNDGYAIIQGEV